MVFLRWLVTQGKGYGKALVRAKIALLLEASHRLEGAKLQHALKGGRKVSNPGKDRKAKGFCVSEVSQRSNPCGYVSFMSRVAKYIDYAVRVRVYGYLLVRKAKEDVGHTARNS